MNRPIGHAQMEGHKVDRLDVSARFTEHDAVRLNRMFRGSSTQEMLEAVIKGS
ncbi:MAG: phosphoadenosine phosphosulfate reductase, partial [Erythrobacter sp.]|nr:phosphoadenosine phosphosulfate reductase [Erythrobacter sp.]